MVRFARAEGSLGCNKKVLEDATPWAEMVAQRQPGNITPVLQNKGKKGVEAGVVTTPQKKKKSKNLDVDAGTVASQNDITSKNENKKRKKDVKNGDVVTPPKKKKVQDNGVTYVDESVRTLDVLNSPKNKKSKVLDNGAADFNLGESLFNQKEIKGGIDYVDSEQAILKSGKNEKEKNKDGVGSDHPVIDSEKNEMEKKKRNRKKNKENNATPKKVEFTVNAKGQRVKVFKDGKERTWFDLPYEENERMTRYDNMWVKRKMVDKLDELKGALNDQGLGKKEIMRKMMKAKRKAHQELRIELIYEQKRLVKEQKGGEELLHKKKKRKSGSAEEEFKEINKNENSGNLGQVSEQEGGEESLPKEKKKKKGKSDLSNEELKEINKNENSGILGQVSEQEGGEESLPKEKKKKKGKSDLSNEELKEINKNENSSNFWLVREQEGGEESLPKKKKTKKGKSDSAKEELKEINKNGNSSNFGLVSEQEGGEESLPKKKKKKRKSVSAEEEMKEVDKDDNSSNFRLVSDQVGGEESLPKKKKEKKRKSDSAKEELKFQEDVLMTNYEGYREEQNGGEKSLLKKKRESDSAEEELKFQEDYLMTKYEGYWVLRKSVEHLNMVKEQKLQAILSSTNGSVERELTKEENIDFQRVFKKEKRFEHKKLLQELMRRGKRQQKGNKNQKILTTHPPKPNTKKSDDGDVVKFDGFWVKQESAERLTKLREKLRREGVSEEELKGIMQKERRKEERLLKNERQLVCLKCRTPGHMVSACPQLITDDTSTQVDICYTCGSTEHTSRTCTLKKPGSEFSLATCYICGESGHISRQCPDNPRGLYPNGGACRGCGSVEHLARDCPDLKEEQEKENLKADLLDGDKIEAIDTPLSTHPTSSPSSGKKMKMIKF